ncbi:MAG TPA: glycosyl transferase, partial [Armatimonadetes bacterium]|nr:glycosyl transferase [Armatimonadota bacterium]
RPHAAAADLGGEPLIVTIGVLGARDRTRAYLDGLGLREGWDYICVA